MPLIFLHVSYFLIKKERGKVYNPSSTWVACSWWPRQRWWQTEACIPPSTELLGSGLYTQIISCVEGTQKDPESNSWLHADSPKIQTM